MKHLDRKENILTTVMRWQIISLVRSIDGKKNEKKNFIALFHCNYDGYISINCMGSKPGGS
jgi:hypothetical protein